MRKPVIAALTLGVLVTLAAIRIVDLWWWRRQALTAAGERARDLAFVLSEYVRETFVAGDASLRQLSVHSQRIGGPSAPAEAWMPSLTSAKAGLAGVGSISVVDAKGIIRHSTLPSIVGESRSDQYAFRKLSAEAGDDFVVNTPYLSVNEPRQFVIPIARRLTTPDGAFDGIIVATFLPARPRGLLSSVDIGRHGIVWVFHRDGFVLFREPSATDPLGESAIANPIFQAARRANAAGTIEAPVAAGGDAMVSGFEVTPSPELIVAVSLDRSEILADWRRQGIGSAVVFVVLGLTMAAMVGAMFRQMDAKAAAERALTLAQLAESDTLKEVNERLALALAIEQRARHESEEVGRLKDEFVMTVSHELRTPLTAITGWAQMIESGMLNDQQKAAASATIARNARMQMRLIEDLLDLSQIIGGKLRLDPRPVRADEIIDQAIENVNPAAAAKRVRLDTAIDPAATSVVADPDRLQQIIWNLLSNAIKFTPTGGAVEIRLGRVDDGIEIAVSDTGVGISPEFLPHVFERFRQADGGARRRHGGLGLGLAIVRHLVELHGGIVTAESAGEGRGATFRVRLPVRS